MRRPSRRGRRRRKRIGRPWADEMASGDKRRPGRLSRAKHVGRAVIDGFLALTLCYMVYLIASTAVDTVP